MSEPKPFKKGDVVRVRVRIRVGMRVRIRVGMRVGMPLPKVGDVGIIQRVFKDAGYIGVMFFAHPAPPWMSKYGWLLSPGEVEHV